MFLKSNRCKRLNYSSLEDRRLLAGNIRVVENVHLYIRGDQADNQFEVVVEGDQLQINGLDGTTINGEDSFVVAGAKVTESGVKFDGGLRAHLGPGHDDFAITDAQFEDLSIVYGGTGNDLIEVLNSTFLDEAIFQTYEGDDSVSVTGSHFEDTFRAMTLGGEDSVTMIDSVLAGDSIVVTGDDSDSIHSDGNHYLGEVNLVLPLDGDDTVQLNNPVVGEHPLGIFLGSGDDTISADLTEATIDGTIRIGGQGGVDQTLELTMSDEVASSVIVDTLEHREVFDGGVGGAANVDGGRHSVFIPSTNVGSRYATPVVLDATETITSVEWTGTYFRESLGEPAPEGDDFFVIEIYEDAGDGAPDSSSVVRFEVGGANRVESGVTVGTFDAAVHEYSANIEFTMQAGTEYWVSIYTEVEASATDFWGWGQHLDIFLEEAVQRNTWEPDLATSGDNDWRVGGPDDRRPDIAYSSDFDIRLRT